MPIYLKKARGKSCPSILRPREAESFLKMILSNSLQFDKITFFLQKDLRSSHEYDNIIPSLFEKTEAQVK